MKRLIQIALALAAVLLPTTGLSAQSENNVNLTNHLKPYGFFRAAAIFDSRDSKAGPEDLFYFLPLDKAINLNGMDVNYNPSFKMSAVTTRLGLDVSGFQYGNFSVTGKLEADFYLMVGSTASLRLREAYAKLAWDKVGYNFATYSLKVGQAWHPMSADQPYCINVETGSPFNPFNWSPQILVGADYGKWSLSAGVIYPMQFLPTGPSGPSEGYVKYGLIPEIYAGVSYEEDGFLARVGADFLSLKPRWRTASILADTYDVGTKTEDRISMVSPMAYLQYTSGAFKINAKSVLAQGGDHLRLMGGYVLSDASDPLHYEYVPLLTSSSFVSFSYGRKFQVMCMAGYMRALGTNHMLDLGEAGYLDPDDIFYFSDGFKNISQMFRATPTLAYNFGKLTFGVEYDCTGVEYGDIDALNNHALAIKDLHMILNHRVMGVLKYNF